MGLGERPRAARDGVAGSWVPIADRVFDMTQVMQRSIRGQDRVQVSTVPPLLYDAAISYARDDDVLHNGVVSDLRDLLLQRIPACIRRRFPTAPADGDAEIFMDKSGLPANGDLTQELRAAVRQSLFLIVVVGCSYPRSRWCGMELEAFTEQFAGVREEALQRTFVLVLEREALRASWGGYLDKPERPIYTPLFDRDTGQMIPVLLPRADFVLRFNKLFTDRVMDLIETMLDRAVHSSEIYAHLIARHGHA